MRPDSGPNTPRDLGTQSPKHYTGRPSVRAPRSLVSALHPLTLVKSRFMYAPSPLIARNTMSIELSLSPARPRSVEADAIIVLTGGHFRLNAAIDLLRAGKGERLLISGVNPIARDNELREATGLDAALFACCVDIDRAALDTIGNAAESAKWVEQHGFDSIILVTNNYHMPRSLLEMHRLLAAVEMSPYPVVNSPIDGGGWMTKPDVVRVLFTEYVKYMTALARSLVTSPTIPPDLAAARARAH